MKFFIDTEFIEGFSASYYKLPVSFKQRHYIDLISIGITDESGREYYAISNEFNPDHADKWVQDNVLYPIMAENGYSKNLSNLHGCLGYESHAIKRVQKRIGKSNQQIAKEVLDFIYGFDFSNADRYSETALDANMKRNTPIEMYGYYSGYDWVLFCSLFGRMIDLPKYFPMYCRDLKQIIDEKVYRMTEGFVPDATFENKLNYVKQLKEYPKEVDEHNALADARWNKKLFDFIKTL